MLFVRLPSLPECGLAPRTQWKFGRDIEHPQCNWQCPDWPHPWLNLQLLKVCLQYLISIGRKSRRGAGGYLFLNFYSILFPEI